MSRQMRKKVYRVGIGWEEKGWLMGTWVGSRLVSSRLSRTSKWEVGGQEEFNGEYSIVRFTISGIIINWPPKKKIKPLKQVSNTFGTLSDFSVAYQLPV